MIHFGTSLSATLWSIFEWLSWLNNYFIPNSKDKFVVHTGCKLLKHYNFKHFENLFDAPFKLHKVEVVKSYLIFVCN